MGQNYEMIRMKAIAFFENETALAAVGVVNGRFNAKLLTRDLK
jgi:hypothetical protein